MGYLLDVTERTRVGFISRDEHWKKFNQHFYTTALRHTKTARQVPKECL